MDKQPLIKAIEFFDGNQSRLAVAITERLPLGREVKQQHIWNWLHRDKGLPPQYAIAIEKATKGKVKRHEWAPEFYPEEEEAAA